MKSTVTFGNLGRLTENDEGSADIYVGDNLGAAQCVGYITREVSWTKSGSSRQNVAEVLGYLVESWGDGDELSKLSMTRFSSLKDAKDAVRAIYSPRKRKR